MVNQPTIHDRYARRLAEPNWYTQWCTPAVVGYADASSEIHNDTMTDNRPTIKKLQVVQAGPPLVKAIPYRAITPVNTFDAVAAIPVRLTQGSFLDMTYFFFPHIVDIGLQGRGQNVISFECETKTTGQEVCLFTLTGLYPREIKL